MLSLKLQHKAGSTDVKWDDGHTKEFRDLKCDDDLVDNIKPSINRTKLHDQLKIVAGNLKYYVFYEPTKQKLYCRKLIHFDDFSYYTYCHYNPQDAFSKYNMNGNAASTIVVDRIVKMVIYASSALIILKAFKVIVNRE